MGISASHCVELQEEMLPEGYLQNLRPKIRNACQSELCAGEVISDICDIEI